MGWNTLKHTFSGYEINIIRHLHRHKYYGRKHTSIENLKKGVNRDRGKFLDKAINSLISKQIIIVQIKTKETHVSLNVSKVNIIREIMSWYASKIGNIEREDFLSRSYEFEE